MQNRRKPFFAISLLALAVVAIAVAACGGGNGGQRASRPTGQATEGYNILPVSGPVVLGENRIAFVIQDADNLPVDADQVLARFFRVEAQVGRLAGEAIATERRFEDFFPHIHPDNSRHIHQETTVFYTVEGFNVDTVGAWGIQVIAILPDGSEIQAQTNPFQIQPRPEWPTAGRPVPATHNPTLRDVGDITKIDTSNPPRPFMHEVAIDEALAQRKPFVVTFSTPAFCQSAVCGPVTDIVASLHPRYGDRVAFIHVEPYNLDVLQNERRYELTPIVEEWGIPSEPWTFVVGADGRVVADFGGLFAAEELEAAIQKALGT